MEAKAEVEHNNQRLRWYQQITVEPTMFLYMFAFMCTSVVEQAFFVNKACIVNHNYTKEICDNIELRENQAIKKIVQGTVSDFHQMNNIAAHIYPIILALFLGSWSDRRGRKFPLLMGIFGKLIYSIMIIVNDSQPSWPLEYVIYTATIPSTITGADVAIFASCFAYISDVSSLQDRTMRVTILDICYMATMPTGIALGSFLFKNVFNRSYSWMFAINASLLMISFVYSFLALKWQTTPNQRSLREVGCCGIFGDFFDKKHIVESFNVLGKKREMNRRTYLAIFLISMALYTFQRDERQFLYLYTQLNWNWDVIDFSEFRIIQSTAYVVAMLAAVPLMSKLFKWKDTTIVMFGSAAHAIARIIYILAKARWVFYIGSAICSLGPIVGPLLRSLTSKTVPISERGKVFALLAVCDNAVPFVSSVLYTQVYKLTMDTNGGIFYLTLATQIIVFILALAVHLSLGNRTLGAAEDARTDVLINGQNSDVSNQS